MKSLMLAFCDESLSFINSKKMLIKLIVNCEVNFKPYAKFWLSPIMKFILDEHLGKNFNYFLTDVVI